VTLLLDPRTMDMDRAIVPWRLLVQSTLDGAGAMGAGATDAVRWGRREPHDQRS
jgi:hypothetical protein